nr:prolyl oligopeptidase family serine peptidase [uncultured Azospirillum sp.]
MHETIFLSPWGETGRQVEMLVQRPKTDGPRPAVMLMHGHQPPPNQPGARWTISRGHFQSVLAMGYVAAAVSMPGYGRSVGPPDFCGPRSQEAVRAGLAHLRAMPDVDPDRIAICGWSRGAVVAAMVATQEPSLRALVLASGNYDFRDRRSFAITGIEESYLEEVAGEEYDAGIRARSATMHAERILARTLIIHGDQDDRTHPAQAVAFHERLASLGRPVRMVMFSGVGHDLPPWLEGAEIASHLRVALEQEGAGRARTPKGISGPPLAS